MRRRRSDGIINTSCLHGGDGERSDGSVGNRGRRLRMNWCVRDWRGGSSGSSSGGNSSGGNSSGGSSSGGSSRCVVSAVCGRGGYSDEDGA